MTGAWVVAVAWVTCAGSLSVAVVLVVVLVVSGRRGRVLRQRVRVERAAGRVTAAALGRDVEVLRDRLREALAFEQAEADAEAVVAAAVRVVADEYRRITAAWQQGDDEGGW